MSKVRLYGDTSGFVDLKAPDVASNVTITLPNTTGPFATETYVNTAVAGIAGIGSNVVQTVKDDAFTSTSTTFVALTGLSVTITPSSATSKILVMADLQMSATAIIFVQLFRGATRIYQGQDGTSTPFDNFNATTFENFAQSDSRETRHPTKVFLDSPATTSAVTYSLEARVDTGTMYLNRQAINASLGSVSSITAIEVAV